MKNLISQLPKDKQADISSVSIDGLITLENGVTIKIIGVRDLKPYSSRIGQSVVFENVEPVDVYTSSPNSEILSLYINELSNMLKSGDFTMVNGNEDDFYVYDRKGLEDVYNNYINGLIDEYFGNYNSDDLIIVSLKENRTIVVFSKLTGEFLGSFGISNEVGKFLANPKSELRKPLKKRVRK